METSEHSQLPEWKTTLFHLDSIEGSYDMLEVTCPRSDCEKVFWVRPVWAYPRYSKYLTRPCPWCFKTAWLPGCKPGGSPPKRKVVRRKKSV